MSLTHPTTIELAIYFAIFVVGVIVGRILMAIQVASMKKIAGAKSARQHVQPEKVNKVLTELDDEHRY